MNRTAEPSERRSIVERWEGYYSSGQAIGGYPVSPEVERLFVDRVSEDTTVLEIGCGSGRSYAHLMDLLSSWDRHAPFYVGADASSSALRMSGRRTALNPVLCDIFHLPFDSESFNIVYSRNTFAGYSPHSIVAASRELHRVLTSGGIAALEERGEFDRKTPGGNPTIPDNSAPPLNRDRAAEMFNPFAIVKWSEEVRKRKTSAGTVTVHAITVILAKG